MKPSSRDGTNLRWHYTKSIHLSVILRDGFIKPATAGVPAGEKPIVWFSSNSQWELTAAPGIRIPGSRDRRMSMGETAQRFGLARIGVDPTVAPHEWKTLKELSGMSSKTAASLHEAGIRDGARPGEWWGTFEPVPRDVWRVIELWDGNHWAPLAKASLGSIPSEVRLELQRVVDSCHDEANMR